MRRTQQDLLAALLPALSLDRISAYRRPGDSDGDILSRYLWNIRLSEALYPALGALEVTVRNSLHAALTQAYGTPKWYDLQSVLDQAQQQKVAEAKYTLWRDRKPQTPGRVVAELTFGFWISLFNVSYEIRPNGRKRFWPRLLQPVLPAMPNNLRTRATVSARLTDVRKVRNRVFHHEPVWQWPHLQTQHAEILELIGWMNQDLHNVISLFDRFPTVYAGGQAYLYTELQTILL